MASQREDGELIWNVAWEAAMDQNDATPAEAQPPPLRAEPAGFLSLARSAALDDPRVGLDSPRLRSAAAANNALAEALAPLGAALEGNGGAPRYAPTRGERRRWSSEAKFSTGSTSSEAAASKEGEVATEAARAADLARYTALKTELATISTGSATVLTLLLCWLYGFETGTSYALGAAGGLLYLRLLTRSVDATSPSGDVSASDVVEGSLGGQRLLIPALLVAGWNRWNALAAPLVHFDLAFAPMLAGFFSYKIGSFVQLIRDLRPSNSSSKD